jgi:thioredoxin-related protein
MKMRSFTSLLIAFGFVANMACAGWQTDYEQALATAKTGNKCVLLAFTGSDWCGPCIQMNKTVFSKTAFLDFAEKNLILVEVDYPRRKQLPEKVTKQNERLLHQYDIENSGFPTVILLNPDGQILGKLEGYGGEVPADIITWVEKLCGKSPHQIR